MAIKNTKYTKKNTKSPRVSPQILPKNEPKKIMNKLGKNGLIPKINTPINIVRQIETILDNKELNDNNAMRAIVGLIKKNFHANVCSFYVRRAGDILELYATDGLLKSAEHKTHLRIGEGVVGKIATLNEPYYVADITQDKDFAYRPETGEDKCKTTIGISVAPGGRMVGVLLVQFHNVKIIKDDEMYRLRLLSLVIGDIRRHARHILNPQEVTPVDGLGIMPLRLTGLPISSGLAMGVAVLHKRDFGDFEVFSNDIQTEHDRLTNAINQLHEFLDNILAKLAKGSEQSEIMESIRLMAEDKSFITKMFKFVDDGITAEAAVQKTLDDLRDKMANVADSYIAQRIDDIEDLASKLLFFLASKDKSATLNLPENSILVGRNISASDILSLDLQNLKGIISEEGNFSSHLGIIARALEIPFIGRLQKIFSRVAPKDLIALDGDHGVCYIRPGEEFRQRYREAVALHSGEMEQMRNDAKLPSITTDGVPINLYMNAALLMDLPHLTHYGALGVGLYRTEMPFLNRDSLPDFETQKHLYSEVYKKLPGKPITFRTLDIGSDKALPYFHRNPEDNPALGWRAIRVSLDSVGLFKTQVRAMCEAANEACNADGHQGENLRIMFPMVTTANEFMRAKDIVKSIAKNYPHIRKCEVGSMLEVPAFAFCFPEIAREIDFISIGTNDLSQFFFAADRDNKKVNQLYSVLNKSFMVFMKNIHDQCATHNIPVSICGESAADPLNLCAYLGLGFKNFSMNARSLGFARRAIRLIDHHNLHGFIQNILTRPNPDIRTALINYATDHQIILKN